VQHEVLEGEKATAFSDGDDLSIVVTCKSDTSKLKEPVQYARFASIEVAAAAGIAVYDEIKTRLRIPIPVTPRVRGRG
jgi:citrate lyase beta subunit